MEEQNVKKELTLEDIAKECVSKITFDINMRSGFGAAYRMIDPSMKEEILRGWVHSVKEVLEKSGLSVTKEVPIVIPNKVFTPVVPSSNVGVPK